MSNFKPLHFWSPQAHGIFNRGVYPESITQQGLATRNPRRTGFHVFPFGKVKYINDFKNCQDFFSIFFIFLSNLLFFSDKVAFINP